MKISSVWRLVVGALVASKGVEAVVEIDVNNRDSLIKFARETTYRVLSYYSGNITGNTPGVLDPYYWWEAGAMWGTLIDYWWYTDDESNTKTIQDALIHQAAEGWYYEPRNRTLELGNDDQGYWAIAVMAAAEKRFPEVPPERGPGWLALAQRVWERQYGRWSMEECNGGLHWQITETNNGYNYKNTVSNGLYFQLGARLARYTGNETYARIASEAYDWMEIDRGYISDKGQVFDGAHLPDCVNIHKVEWSYNSGIVLAGAAFMWNITQEDKWKERVERILDHSLSHFSREDIPHLTWEYACESRDPPNCDQDQRWFKGHLHRFLGLVYQLCPFTQEKITPKLKVSAEYGAKTCTGGPAGDKCGMRWWFEGGGVFDGFEGVALESSVLEAVQTALLTIPKPVQKEPKWIYKASDGGKASRNNSALGDLDEGMRKLKEITTGQRAGAWIMTIIMVVMACGLVYFVAPNK